MSAIPRPNLIPDDYSAPIFYNATSDWESLNYYQDVELEIMQNMWRINMIKNMFLFF